MTMMADWYGQFNIKKRRSKQRSAVINVICDELCTSKISLMNTTRFLNEPNVSFKYQIIAHDK